MKIFTDLYLCTFKYLRVFELFNFTRTKKNCHLKFTIFCVSSNITSNHEIDMHTIIDSFCMQSLPAMIYRSKPRSSASYGGRKIKDAHGNYIVEACTIISKVRDLTRVGSQRESWLIIRDPRERRRRSRRALK